VADFGKAWEQATLDPELEGHWKKAGEDTSVLDTDQSFVRQGDVYRLESESASRPMIPGEKNLFPRLCKTIVVGKHKFLLTHNQKRTSTTQFVVFGDDLASGTKMVGAERTLDRINFPHYIQRYTIQNGILTFYSPMPGMIETAVTNGTVQGHAFNVPTLDSGTQAITGLANLDETTQQFLARLADEPQNWGETKFTSVKDLAKDLEKSRTYPGGTNTTTNTTVRVNLSGYQFFCEGNGELFRRHLQASPEWDVFQDGMEVVAYRRYLTNGKWSRQGGGNGYVNNRDEMVIDPAFQPVNGVVRRRPISEIDKYQIRYKFRFDMGDGIAAPTPTHRQMLELYTKVVAPTAGDVLLKLKKGQQGIESILTVGKPGLWFDFFEQAGKEERIKTREALLWLDSFSCDLREAAKEIEENGYAEKQMPQGSIRHGKPVLELAFPNYPTEIEITAAVNPGRQGFVFPKAFSVNPDGSALPVAFTSWKEKEYIGWSKHPETLFPFYTELRLSEKNITRGMKIRVELWFRPTDGTGSKKWFTQQADAGDVKLLESTKEF
jgi:hypothetical protein